MDFTIRAARPEEYEEAGAIAAQAYVDGAGLAPDDGYLPRLRDAADRAAHAELLVAADAAGALLGTVTFAAPGTPYTEIAGPGEGEFRMLAVTAGARGRGVGEALVRACLDRARALGLDRLVLSVIAANQGPQRLYRRVGFRPLPDRDWEPIPGAVLHVYGLEL